MAALLKNVTNSIWHAFSALQQDDTGFVGKSKLKVLTANIATLLDLYGVERGLDHYRSTPTINFDHFLYYLGQEVFSPLSNELPLSLMRNYESKIDEVCWFVCHKDYQISSDTYFTEETVYQLFRIFCLMADLYRDDVDENQFSVKIHPSEALIVVKQLLNSLGLDYNNEEKYDYLKKSDNGLFFGEFLDILRFKDYDKVNDYVASICEAIGDIYQTLIMDVIKKGYLFRRGYVLPTFREYFFVLQPCELSYYKHHTDKDTCGAICLDSKFMVKPSMSSSGKTERIQKFTLVSGDRTYELGAQDHKTRLQWISALQLAITYSTGREGFQRDTVNRRKQHRELELRKRQEEEQIRNNHLKRLEETNVQLEQEKLARLAAESQARQFEAVAREDSRRVAELEDVKMSLEKMLEDEIQAKRDEEIVRALQARVLAEEWEKREELEQLQSEQKTLLEQERQKRIEFEHRQQDNDKRLKEAEQKLRQLEDERKRLDRELKQARQKIQLSEDNKGIVEAKLQAMAPTYRKAPDFMIRRTQSFVASDRPVIVPAPR
ncbi:switch-associated protein 70-like [Uranotaenia lowii]|uniref:switch-associated protein 70-like n=1 Tax=Uranotaenia lowii TaxID=190385 RepID=UPI002478DD3F|nr:switch-associated protein 70-like [Uranotaenia lowii]XP_055594175.1 switch-associated protein 70-like [Uranotaenia lowii]XP_055594176.1 switch-associated protein 70-like [Uranotaenia lowii]XP_055594177.1 switch-associated protein 70-like [Uranotaenia lowii]XP_055594178.1 switch-associated protein 70-like [Uranotaenia lowii]XP_055594179.1 switch-associated protein 70-like [Uranotaenia lowii]XP_055594180.1 switch-associated protein 70-like [Uranotaenia lowii]